MVRVAFKEHVEPALAGDGFHDAERQVETFEHRPLLDMKLDVSKGVVTGPRFVDSLRIQAERGDRVSDHREQSIIDVADESSASDKRDPKTHAFFFGESDYFDRKRQSPSARRSIKATPSTTPKIPSNAPARGTVSRCEPMNRRFEEGRADG